MPKDKSDDILFDIDMQLYDEFNDKFCEMNDNLGTIYTYKDLDDLEKAEKEEEIQLLREAVNKLQKELEEYKTLLKKQEELDKEKENLIKQGWLNG